MNDRRPIAAAIVHNNGKVLLIERRVPEGPLLWAFVSGEIEDGESPSLAAQREVLEEVGLLVVAGEVIGSRIHPYTKREMTYVACAQIDGVRDTEVLDTNDIASFRWCSYDEMEDLTGGGVYEPVREYLRTLLH